MDNPGANRGLKAAAVRYSKDLPCPLVIAKGTQHRAEKILEIAEKHGIKVIQDQKLTDRLYELEIDHLIPENLYEPLARLLSFVYTLSNNERKQND
ncbi:EscU/YscU/HrcU family type III secretion system export apparatus switch protein [Spirochaeta dissipatitropha]